MKKSLEMIRNGFQTSSGLTPEFQSFFNTFKKEFTNELKSIGATNIVFSRGHFYVSGFFTVNNQSFYFSISDVRFFTDEKLLYRTAKDYNDYSGGHNRYVKIEKGMSKKMSL